MRTALLAVGGALVVLAVPGTAALLLSSSGTGTQTSAEHPAPAAGTAGSAGRTAADGTTPAAGAPDSGGAPTGPASSAEQDGSPLGAPGATAGPARVPPGGPERVVKTGQVALAAPDGQVTGVLDAVQRAAVDAGGQVFDSRTEEQGERPYGSVTLRVPAPRFEALLLRVRGLAEVRSASAAGQDVTSEYRDLESRIRSLGAARDRFLTLLGRADRVAEVLSVQQHVDRVTAELDALEGQRALLRDRSDFSTLTVTVAERDDPSTRTEPGRPGFADAFTDAWLGFTGGLQTLVRHSGGAAVVLLCAAALALLLRPLARRLRVPPLTPAPRSDGPPPADG